MLALLACGACSGGSDEAAASTPCSARDEAGHSDAGRPVDRSLGDDGGASTSSARAGFVLELEPAVLCPGQCASVRVVPAPRPGTQIRWQPELPEEPGPHQLCPDATTTVEVTLSDDGAGPDEFRSTPLTLSAELGVRDDCDAPRDAGAAADGATPAQRQPTWPAPEPPRCVEEFEASAGALILGIAGGEEVVVVGSFKGQMALGDQLLDSGLYPELPPSAALAGFAAKFDRDCRPLWARAFLGTARTFADRVALTPAGDVVIAGAFAGTVDLGGAPLVAYPTRDLFLVELDGDDGSFVWQRQFPTQALPGDNHGVGTMAIDEAGAILLAGYTNDAVDFGGGLLTPAADGRVYFLVELDATGALRYQKSLPSSVATVLPGDDGAIAFLPWQGVLTWGAATRGQAEVHYEALAGLDPSGAPTWSSLTATDIEGIGYSWQSLVRGADGLLHHGHLEQLSDEEIGFSLLSARSGGDGMASQGPLLFGFRQERLNESPYYDHHFALSVDGVGMRWVATHFDQFQHGAGAELPNMGGRDVVVLRLAADGHVDWVGTYGTAEHDLMPRLQATPSGAAVVAGAIAGAPGRWFVARFEP